jgi:ADP-ribose pyrophosphatase
LNAEPKGERHADDLEQQELLFLNQQELEAALDRGEFKVLAWATVVALGLRYLAKNPAPPK